MIKKGISNFLKIYHVSISLDHTHGKHPSQHCENLWCHDNLNFSKARRLM